MSVHSFVTGFANKRPLHIPNMRSPHVNSHRVSGDVSGLNKHGSVEDEVQGASDCGDNRNLGHIQCTFNGHNPCTSSRGVVDNTNCQRMFGEGMMPSSVLHPAESATSYDLGNIFRCYGYPHAFHHAYVAYIISLSFRYYG